jgi:repressor LexA
MINQAVKRKGRPPVEGLTKKQRATLRAVRDFRARRGYSPTLDELGVMLNITGATAYASVNQLIRKGYLTRANNKRRGILIAREPQDEIAERVEVPILGKISAGMLSFAEENIIGQVNIDAYLTRHGRFFGLKVMGDSMIEAGISEGDTVVVKQQPLAENGDIVVACVGDEGVVKRLAYSPDHIEL